MSEPGLLTLVLGGKNLGKSFLKKIALKRCCSDLVVVSVDMRSRAGMNLLEAILVSANQTLEEVDDERDNSAYLGCLASFPLLSLPSGTWVRQQVPWQPW